MHAAAEARDELRRRTLADRLPISMALPPTQASAAAPDAGLGRLSVISMVSPISVPRFRTARS